MFRAKNYKTATKFVKVMPRILWPLFFPDTVYISGPGPRWRSLQRSPRLPSWIWGGLFACLCKCRFAL